MIVAKELSFDYIKNNEDGTKTKIPALKHVNFELKDGQFIAVLGHNGSGKSTLAKHLNALFIPTGGLLWVDGMDTSKEEFIWDIRKTVGMVFQNPDNQIIASIVEEDVAFGPENLGVPPEQIRTRVDDALASVSMQEFAKHSPHMLSGGQKQRIAIASILAMKPKCIVLDEATAMLDPIGRREVMDTIKRLNKEGITIIHITHYVDEAAMADRVIVMDDGVIVLDGEPKDVLTKADAMQKYALELTVPAMIAHLLRENHNISLNENILTIDDLVGALCEFKSKN